MISIHDNFLYPQICLFIYALGRVISLLIGCWYLNKYNEFLFHSNFEDKLGAFILLEVIVTPVYAVVAFFVGVRGKKMNLKPIILLLTSFAFYLASTALTRHVQVTTKIEFDDESYIQLHATRIKAMVESKDHEVTLDLEKLKHLIKKTILDLYSYTVIQMMINSAFQIPTFICFLLTGRLKLYKIVEDPRVIEFRKTNRLNPHLKKPKQD